MSLLNLFSSKEENPKVSDHLKEFLTDFSIEVMPRTAAKIESFDRDSSKKYKGLYCSY